MDNSIPPALAEYTDLLTKAESLELAAFGKNNDLISRTYPLGALLEAAYKVRCPEPYEHANRRDLIRIFNVMARELFGNDCPVVEEFGSFVMNMFNSESDLDLSINFNNGASAWSKKERVNALRRFSKKFRSLQSRGVVKDVLLVPTAKVPVLKVTDQGTNIECDFSVENRDGVTKSHIVFIIATIDERFRKLSVMLKAWAKAHSINSSKDGTLNSLSLILFAAFHLQRTEPPILPPFSAFLKDGFDLPTVQKNVAPYVNYGEKNMESLVQLFVTLLIRLKSVETLWSEGLCASVYEGCWIYKKFKNKLGIYVEDFTDRSQNVARALHSKKVRRVHSSIDKSLANIQNFLDGKIQWNLLERSLFGMRPPRLTKSIITLHNTPHHPVLHLPIPTNQEVRPPYEESRIVLDKKKKTKKRKRKEAKVMMIPEGEKQLARAPPMKRVMIPEGGGASSHGERIISREVETVERREISHTVENPSHFVLDKKKKKKRRMNSVSSESVKQHQPPPPPRKQVIIPESARRNMSYEVEAFEGRGSYNNNNNTTRYHPSVYMHNYAPAFGHGGAAPSSQSFGAYPPFRNVPSHPPPPQFVARYPPPIRDPVYDPYYPQPTHSVYRVALSSYPVGREPYRTPEVPYSREREPYRTSEVPYSREREPYRTPEVPYSREREPYRTSEVPYSREREPYRTSEVLYSGGREPYRAPEVPYSRGREPYRAPEVPYSGGREPYRAPEVSYSGGREHYRTSEAPYPGRLEQVWSDYSREVRREAPSPGYAHTWSDDAPRGAHGPPSYR